MRVAVAAVGIVTGWGEGVGSLPPDARAAASGRRVVAAARPSLDGDRFRRATRECLHGVAAVQAMLREGGLRREDLHGPATALIYVTAAAYGSSNLAFASGAGARTLHFPYTAPSAVPAEVAIEFGLTGPYVILVGGATTTLDALWQAECLVDRGQADRALVLAVETFAECEALWARGRWTVPAPLVEAAGAALLVPAVDPARDDAVAVSLDAEVAARAGETLACAPLIALALARERRVPGACLGAVWRDRRGAHDARMAYLAHPA